MSLFKIDLSKLATDGEYNRMKVYPGIALHWHAKLWSVFILFTGWGRIPGRIFPGAIPNVSVSMFQSTAFRYRSPMLLLMKGTVFQQFFSIKGEFS